MRQYYIAGNWKMNNTVSEAVNLTRQLINKVKNTSNKVMIAPPFTALSAVKDLVKGTNIRLGAQNMAMAESGAHTGEVSVLMLTDVGAETVILGHSERRTIYLETDTEINKKVRLALLHGLEVILCVGETLEQREKGEEEKVVVSQLKAGLEDVTAEQMKQLVMAYEPVWAIGTGKTATPEDAEAVHKVIRSTVKELYSGEVAENLIIQYGGSVKPDNVQALMSMENIDGALVGGASLKAETFDPIVNFNR